MKKILFLALPLLLSFCVQAQGQLPAKLPSTDQIPASQGPISVLAIQHASLVLKWNNKIIYVDPTGGAEKYQSSGTPDLILLTDIHGDHFDPKTLAALPMGNTGKHAMLIAPDAVATLLKADPTTANLPITIVKNGDKISSSGIPITALPMYNLPDGPDAKHPKGRGNGYILTLGGKNIYISGDTQGTPEMLALKNIDAAFLCMNLPYTMDINEAAKSTLIFKPAIVYPYHHRGQDIAAFKQLVNASSKTIDVRLLNWYPN